MNKELLAAMAALLISGNLSYLAADASQPELTQNTGDPNQSTLSWDSEANFIYFVESTDNLVNWSWQTHHLATSAVPVQLTVPTTTTQTAYRLQYTQFAADNASPLLIGDFDGDGISNYDEINTFVTLGLDFLNADSNGNGINDGAEDTDGDGISEYYEFLLDFDPLSPDVLVLNGDDDSDGVINNEDAAPFDPSVGRVAISIAFPLDGGVVQ